MDLVIVTDRWQTDGGGRERIVTDLVRWFQHQSVSCEVWCRSHRGRTADSREAVVRVFAGSAAFAEPRLERAIRRLRRDHPEVPVLATRPQASASHIQLHSGLLREAFAAEREALPSAFRRLLFWPALRLNSHRRRQLAAEATILDKASPTQLMALSKALGNRLCGEHGVDRQRVHQLHLGIDLGQFHPEEASAQTPIRLLFVAHDFALKGLATAIEAVAACRGLGVIAQLDVVGSNRSQPYDRLITSFGVDVHFHGPCSQEELPNLYRRSVALLHPTYYDAFSLVVLEALACGCPVITSRRCGAAELIETGRHGYVVEDHRSVAGFTQAIVDIAGQADHQAMRQAAAELGRGFSFSAFAEGTWQWMNR